MSAELEKRRNEKNGLSEMLEKKSKREREERERKEQLSRVTAEKEAKRKKGHDEKSTTIKLNSCQTKHRRSRGLLRAQYRRSWRQQESATRRMLSPPPNSRRVGGVHQRRTDPVRRVDGTKEA
jgi:hypothetical protein